MKPDPPGALDGGGRAWFPKWTPPHQDVPQVLKSTKAKFLNTFIAIWPKGRQKHGFGYVGGIFSYFGMVFPPSPPSSANSWFPKEKTTFLTQAQVSHQSAFHHHLLSFGFCILHFAPSALPLSETHSFTPLMFIDSLSLYPVSGTTVGSGVGRDSGRERPPSRTVTGPILG